LRAKIIFYREKIIKVLVLPLITFMTMKNNPPNLKYLFIKWAYLVTFTPSGWWKDEMRYCI
jgi:hypothetical protein